MRGSDNVLGVTWLGLVVNLLLGAAKTAGGFLLGSKALLADGLHSVLDLLTDGAVLAGLVMARRPEDANHHFGHHKFASLAKLFTGAVLLVFAALLVGGALLDLRGGGSLPRAGAATLLLVGAIAVKEALFRLTMRVAKRARSALLRANAWHHRSDSLSSVGVLVALLGVWVGGPEWAFLDGAVTLVLGCYLVFQAGKIVSGACADLLDAAPERAIVDDFREHILPTPGAVAYHDFRVRRVGDLFEVDLHLQVDPELTVAKGHAIAKAVKERLLRQHPEVGTVLVHVEPADEAHVVDRGFSGADAARGAGSGGE